MHTYSGNKVVIEGLGLPWLHVLLRWNLNLRLYVCTYVCVRMCAVCVRICMCVCVSLHTKEYLDHAKRQQNIDCTKFGEFVSFLTSVKCFL